MLLNRLFNKFKCCCNKKSSREEEKIRLSLVHSLLILKACKSQYTNSNSVERDKQFM